MRKIRFFSSYHFKAFAIMLFLVGIFMVCGAPSPSPYCGDGIVQSPEECDDGNTADGDGCSANCTIEQPEPYCGDGVLDPGEQCDDGNNMDGDGCSANCTIERGGDGCTPGYWKQLQHFDSWVGYNPDDLFSEIFGDDNMFPEMTLLDVLKQGGGGIKALGRHTVAALLNASASMVYYDLDVAQVINQFTEAFYSEDDDKIEDLKDAFQFFNELGCPIN